MKNPPVTVGKLLLEENRVSRPDREWLLQSLLRVGRGDLLLRADHKISARELRKYRLWIDERRRGFPLQYIVGSADFRGLQLSVSPAVLIPRPETEVLVDLALRQGDGLGKKITVLDIGAGSGAIALSIKNERPEWNVRGGDISGGALAVARKNAKRLGLSVEFVKSDLLKKFKGRFFDLVVANPPYVDPARDRVAGDVHEHEPHLALYPEMRFRAKGLGERGAWVAEKIMEAISSGAVGCRVLVLELSPRVAVVLERRWRASAMVERVWREKDLAGRARFLLIAWKNHG